MEGLVRSTTMRGKSDVVFLERNEAIHSSNITE